MVIRNVDGTSTKPLANGDIGTVTRSDTSAILNVDEYAITTDVSSERWGFPKQDGPSLSYWLQQVRCDELVDHRTTSALPEIADTVIIGSGLSGTLIAKSHKEAWPDKSVVVLEAREFCSGATGRNAGHCKPFQWRQFAKFEDKFGSEQAMKILANEQATWTALVSYVRDNNVDCDLWVGDTYDVPTTPGVATIARDCFSRYKAAGGKIDHIKIVDDPIEARRLTRIKTAQACYAWSASTLQPRKLTAHIMRDNIRRGVNLQTFTTACKVDPVTDNKTPHRWLVHTDRGAIATTTVIHASNAYLPAYEPLFRAILQPNPHICNKVIPPLSFSGSRTLQASYGVLQADGAMFSINPRSHSDGVILFGGSNAGQKAFEQWIDAHPAHCVDDSISDVPGVTAEVRRFAETEFDGWTDTPMGPGQGYEYAWSGIIGRTTDGVPFVGPLPGKEGQWVCAGHCGHGMARIFTAAPAVVGLMAGKDWEELEVPDVYRMTAERMERLKRIVEEEGRKGKDRKEETDV